jgi:hypothetical protein
MVRRVARREAVLAPLQMRLQDEVDHVDVIQRVDDVLEDAAPRLRRFAVGQCGDGIGADDTTSTPASRLRPETIARPLSRTSNASTRSAWSLEIDLRPWVERR